MSSNSRTFTVVAVLAAVAVGVFAYMSTTEPTPLQGAPVPQVVATSPVPMVAASVSAVAPSDQETLPSNILLVGTTVDVGAETATFLVDDQMVKAGVGAHLVGSIDVIKKIGTTSVWMGPVQGDTLREITVSSPKVVAERLNEAKLAAAARPNFGGRPLSAGESVVLKDESGHVPPPEQQVHVRKRVPQRAGPVGTQ